MKIFIIVLACVISGCNIAPNGNWIGANLDSGYTVSTDSGCEE